MYFVYVSCINYKSCMFRVFRVLFTIFKTYKIFTKNFNICKCIYYSTYINSSINSALKMSNILI